MIRTQVTPRAILAHRIVEQTLEQVGLTVPTPGPEAWYENPGGETVLLDERGERRIATVTFDPPARPRTAVLELHTIRLTREPLPSERRHLVADVRIGPGLLADVFGEEAPR